MTYARLLDGVLPLPERKRERKSEGQEGRAWVGGGQEENCTTVSNVNPFAPGKQLKSASALNPKHTFFLQWVFGGECFKILQLPAYFLRFTQGELL